MPRYFRILASNGIDENNAVVLDKQEQDKKEHKQMLSHLHFLITKNYLAIPSKYNELIISLRTAYANELSLDKNQTSYNDLFDALRLSLKGYQIE